MDTVFSRAILKLNWHFQWWFVRHNSCYFQSIENHCWLQSNRFMIEVITHTITGNPFRQSKSMSYYWFHRWQRAIIRKPFAYQMPIRVEVTWTLGSVYSESRCHSKYSNLFYFLRPWCFVLSLCSLNNKLYRVIDHKKSNKSSLPFFSVVNVDSKKETSYDNPNTR